MVMSFFPKNQLYAKAGEILEVVRQLLELGIIRLTAENRIVVDPPGDYGRPVYLAKYHCCELGTARGLSTLINTPRNVRQVDVGKALEWVQSQMSMSLADKQQEAVRRVLSGKVVVITDGPGTGKTTIIRSILSISSRLTRRILLAAPTGRAAKRRDKFTGYWNSARAKASSSTTRSIRFPLISWSSTKPR
jgi:exodeoxyribonuclease V alpha subunit